MTIFNYFISLSYFYCIFFLSPSYFTLSMLFYLTDLIYNFNFSISPSLPSNFFFIALNSLSSPVFLFLDCDCYCYFYSFSYFFNSTKYLPSHSTYFSSFFSPLLSDSSIFNFFYNSSFPFFKLFVASVAFFSFDFIFYIYNFILSS